MARLQYICSAGSERPLSVPSCMSAPDPEPTFDGQRDPVFQQGWCGTSWCPANDGICPPMMREMGPRGTDRLKPQFAFYAKIPAFWPKGASRQVLIWN